MTPLERLYLRLYRRRRPLAYALYGTLAAVGYTVAFLLRFDFALAPRHARSLMLTLPAVMAVRIALARVFRLSSGRWRFVGTADAVRLIVAMSTGSAMLLVLRELLPPPVLIPRSVLLIEWVVSSYATAGLWLTYRVGFERVRRARSVNGERPVRRALLVGAGEAGNVLAREIRRYPTGFNLVGFVDDDSLKWGCQIQGVEVLGGTEDLGAIVKAERVDEIILAIPSAEPKELRRLVAQCEETHVPFKVLPGISEVLEGRVGLNQLRDLQVEDLLGRDPIQLELPELSADLEGRCVMITGAAGSIGSELARQCALYRPERLVVLDQSETDLFFLQMELRESYPELDLVAVIGDITDDAQIERVFHRQTPDRVFHAAAYKHVPLMEVNVEQAVKNNVLGTAIVAEAAGRHGAEKFVLVSTDKAVRPANVMGSTKRLAELTILHMQDHFPDTAFGAVRFGNVLGSRGSVLPIFRRQVASSKPLTVTHPEVTRYFMTIPEAVQLILQASLLPDFRGHIAMLDMGEPVKIVELAQNVLRLSGISPRMGETYRFTGLRPGEKMHEELAAPDESMQETSIAKVRLLTSCRASTPDIRPLLNRWDRALSNGHAGVVEKELRGIFSGLREPRPNGTRGNGALAMSAEFPELPN